MNLEIYKDELKNKASIYNTFIFVALLFVTSGNIFIKDRFIANDFSYGLVYGIFIGIELICIYNVVKINKILKSEDLLKEMFIKDSDEREKYIKLKSGYPVISKISIFIGIMAILASFFNKTVFITLLGVVIFLKLVSIGLKIYWQNKI